MTVTGTAPVRLSVIDAGPLNPPGRGTIVCMHGAGGAAAQWQAQIDHLASHYRVVAPDLRGHGHSQAPASAYSLEEFLWDFSQVLHTLAVPEPFVLMSHSFGGPIALTFAATQPKRISKLILIATAPEIRLNRLQEFMIRLPIAPAVVERLRPILWPKTFAPALVLKRVLGGTMFHWRGYELLPTLRMPTLVIAGQWDFIVTLAMARKTAELLPNARLEVVRYTRHLPQIERPAAVNRLIDRFLEGPRGWRDE